MLDDEAAQSMTAASLRSVTGRASSCSSQMRCSFSRVSSRPAPTLRPGREGGRQLAHALDDADALVVDGAFGIAAVVGHPVQNRGQHRLEHRARHVRSDAAVHADAEAEVPVAFTVEYDAVRVGEHRGVAIGHGPRNPQPLTLFELVAVDFDIVGEGPAVAGRRGEEAQELLGRGVEQGIAVFAVAALAVRDAPKAIPANGRSMPSWYRTRRR